MPPRELRADVGQDVAGLEVAEQREGERHAGVEVRAGDVAQRVNQGQDDEAVGRGDALDGEGAAAVGAEMTAEPGPKKTSSAVPTSLRGQAHAAAARAISGGSRAEQGAEDALIAPPPAA